MKEKIISVLVLAVFALLGQATATWAGESLHEIPLQGATAYKYHKTSFFGRDYAGVTLVGKQEPQPPILRLQYGSSTTTTTTTTFSRCKDKRGDGSYKQAYFVGEEKKVTKQSGFQDAVNPANGQQPWTATVGGDGYSTGNLLLPAIAIGGGNAASGWGAGQARNVINAFGGTGQGGPGGNAWQSQGQLSNNLNANTVIPTTISGSSSTSGATSVIGGH